MCRIWSREWLNASAKIEYADDAFGELIQQSVLYNANTGTVVHGNTLHFYDSDNRLQFAADPLGFVTGHEYDAFGDETLTRKYFNALAAGQTDPSQVTASLAQDRVTQRYFNQDGDVCAVDEGVQYVTSSGALAVRNDGVREHAVYDAFGQVVYTVAPDGGIAHFEYDADGRVLRTTRYAAAVTAADMSTMPLYADAAAIARLAVPATSTSASQDALALNQYDAFGRLRYSMDGTGAISELRYDAGGNVTHRIAYAKPAATAWTGSGTPALQGDTLHDRHTHFGYDAFGELVAQADGTGAVTVNAYDLAGQLRDTTSYATKISIWSWVDGQQLPLTLVPDGARDSHLHSDYDGFGRLFQQQNADVGQTTRYAYDDSGNLTGRLMLDAANTDGGNRSETFEFDYFNEQTWQHDASGALTQIHYDLDGRVDYRIGYAALPTAQNPHPAFNGAVDRKTSLVYDSFGRQRYVTDPRGYVSMTTYDTHGRVATQVSFSAIAAQPASTIDPATTPAVGATDQQTQFGYDAAGRVIRRTDAEGGVRQYQYDALGNQLVFTDEKNQAWTSTYDADGRELSRTSPKVTVTTNHVVRSTDADWSGDVKRLGDLQDGDRAELPIVTTMAYDGVGNLKTRVEGIYQYPTSVDSTDARTTSYDYDAAGRVILTTLPLVDVFDASNGETGWRTPKQQAVYDAFGNVVATTDALGSTSYRTYDQANRLRFAIDAAGYAVGYARNAFGEVIVQTSYGLKPGSIGSQGALDPATNLPATGDVKKAVALLATATNRVTTTSHDLCGRVATTSGSAGSYYGYTSAKGLYGLGATPTAQTTPTTGFTYDVFGELIKQSVLYNANTSTGTYGDTLHFYDQSGNETDTVDPAGYLTQRVFDAFGNTTKTTEWANATSGWLVGAKGSAATTSTTTVAGGAGVDRVTTAVYDRMSRKTAQTRNVGWVQDDTVLTAGTGGLTDRWDYDVQGHVIHTEQGAADGAGLAGRSTFYMYDALGQLRAEVQPSRFGGAGTGSWMQPVTEYAYDAFGNVTRKTEHVNTATGVTLLAGVWTAGGPNGYSVVAVNNAADPNNSDRVTRTAYDAAGRAIQVDDPLAATSAIGHNTVNRYNVGGQLVYTQHLNFGNAGTSPTTIYQRFVYDAKGQLSHRLAPPAGTTTDGTEISTDYEYDAFGERVVKGIDGGRQEFFQYNANGQLWRTNSGDGVVHIYLHDLAGNVTSDLTSRGLGDGTGSNFDLMTLASEADAFAHCQADAALQSANLRVVNTTRDLDGNAVVVAQPSRATKAGGELGVLAGMTSWSPATVDGKPGLTVTYPDPTALGSGELEFEVRYTGSNGQPAIYRSFDTNLRTTSSRFQLPADATPSSIASVTVLKKNYMGDWQALNGLTPENKALARTQVLVAAPDDPLATVSVSYYKQGQSSDTAVTPDLANFGDAYWFDASGLPNATLYNYTVTITAADGSVKTTTGTFKIGQAKTLAAVTTNVTPTTNQVFDRWGNLVSRSDPRNAAWLTKYAYDANDQVLSEYDTSANGNSLITSYAYDRAGNRVAVTDALGRVSGRKYDGAGHVVETHQHSDMNNLSTSLVKTANKYDIFGELVQSIAADGYNPSGSDGTAIADYTTQYTYDALGHLIAQQEGIGAGSVMVVRNGVGTMQNLQQAYTYDADGNRLSSWDGTLSANGTRVVTLYSYDAADHLASTTLAATAARAATSSMGAVAARAAAVTTYAYDHYGHLASETDANNNNNNNSDPATWQLDYFGRQRMGFGSHHDFGGTGYVYGYDNAGQLVSQTSTGGQNLSYRFDAAGQLAQVVNNELVETSSYAYDAAGEPIRESTFVNGQVFQDNHLSYDEHARLVSSYDDASKITFQYDAVGNRLYVGIHLLHEGLTLLDHVAWNGGSYHYFQYDDMNRQVKVNWKSLRQSGVADEQGDDGHVLTYDADGNRTSDTFTGNVVSINNMETSTSIDALYGVKIYTPSTTFGYQSTRSGLVTETYTYDANDRLSQTFYGVTADGVATDVAIDSRRYDAAGRVTNEGTNGNLLTGLADQITRAGTFPFGRNYVTLLGRNVDFETHVNSYDERGQLLNGLVRDQMGNVIANDVDVPTTELSPAGTREARTAHTTMTVVAGEHYETTQESSHVTIQYQDGNNNTQTTNLASSSTTTTYDGSGQVSSILEPDNAALDRRFIYDAQGRVLRTLSGEASTGQHDLRELVVAGEVLGQYGVKVTPNNSGSADVATFTQVDAFDLGYKGLDDPDYDTSSSATTVGANETFFGLAAAAYGNSGLAQRVAQANGMSSHAQLQTGMRLTIAGKSGVSHNDQDSFAAYDPREMMGTQAPAINLPREAVSLDAQNQLYMNRYGTSTDSTATETSPTSSSSGASWRGVGLPLDQREMTVSPNEYNGPTQGDRLFVFMKQALETGGGKGLAGLQATAPWGSKDSGSSTGVTISGGGQMVTVKATDGTIHNYRLEGFTANANGSLNLGNTSGGFGSTAGGSSQSGFGDRNTTSVGDLWSGAGGGSVEVGNASIGTPYGDAGSDPLGNFVNHNMSAWANHVAAVTGNDELFSEAEMNSAAKAANAADYASRRAISPGLGQRIPPGIDDSYTTWSGSERSGDVDVTHHAGTEERAAWAAMQGSAGPTEDAAAYSDQGLPVGSSSVNPVNIATTGMSYSDQRAHVGQVVGGFVEAAPNLVSTLPNSLINLAKVSLTVDAWMLNKAGYLPQNVYESLRDSASAQVPLLIDPANKDRALGQAGGDLVLGAIAPGLLAKGASAAVNIASNVRAAANYGEVLVGNVELLGEDAATRGAAGAAGQPYARNVLDGGTGTAYAGHGSRPAGSLAGTTTIPDGTALTLPRDGIQILDETGQYIERGDWEGLAKAAEKNPRIAADIEGMTTHLPGAEVPNYTLRAPTKLDIYSNSLTVEDPLSLSALLSPNQGYLQWAACTQIRF